MINKDDIISDVIEEYPEASEIFSEYWLWCVWCWASSFETIWDWADTHWFSENETDNLMKDLNEMLEEIEKERKK